MIRVKYIKSEDPRSSDFDELIRTKFPNFLTEENPDLILVTGGDGAMLHAIQANSKYQVPFLGHAAGTLNFLMNRFEDPVQLLSNIVEGNSELHYMDTTSIKVEVLDGNSSLVGYAVNEVVIGSDVMGYHDFNISSDDGSFEGFHIKGTGVSVSTDLGSTGYNFNLGGPILPLGSELWSIVGVVCNRYLNDILHVQKLSINCGIKERNVSVFIDGIKKVKGIQNNSTIVLSQGAKIKIAFLNKSDFIRKRVDITSRFRKSDKEL